MKLVIIAGGKGTRLKNVSNDIPKPMIELCGKPILEHQIELAKKYGITDIIILTGHLSHIIKDYFKDGKKWNINLEIIKESAPLGTAGCFDILKGKINDAFMVFYGDIVMDIDLESFKRFHQEKNGDASLLVHPNDHPSDSDLVEFDENKKITHFHSKPHQENKYFQNMVNAALYILSPKVLDLITPNKLQDFGKDIFPKMLKNNKAIFAYSTSEYIKDMGTPKRLEKVKKDYLSGKIKRLNNDYKRKAIFIDRDGVINEEVSFLNNPDQLKLISKSSEAIRNINLTEYLAICITNQPVIARGECNLTTLKQIHNKLDSLLGKDGAFLDALYFCPHHPDKGYKGEVENLKVKCSCRKPNTGLIKKAQDNFNIDLANSWMIGDSSSDLMLAKNIGIKSILVQTGYGGKDKKFDCTPDHICQNLFEAINFIIGEKSAHN